MTFLAPAMLWSLAVLAPLVAIYFLKVRPRRRPTTAYFLWERVFQEKRASSLLHRLRDTWSLVLMMLAAAAVCFALARPEWSDRRSDLILVIDTSASMGAREGRRTRLELAQDVARDVVEGLNGNQLAAVATLTGRLTYRSHLTDNPRELVDAIDAVRPSGEAIDLAALPGRGEADRWTRDHRVILISDGALDAGVLPPHVELVKVGTSLENVGLVAADMAYVAGSNRRLGFYYQVASTFAGPQQVDLTVSHVDDAGLEQLMKVIPLTIEPGTSRPETLELEDAPAGRWVTRLDVRDALAEDNTAPLAVSAPEPIRVAVASADPFFLENSVQAFARGPGLLALVPERASGNDRPDVVLAKSASPEADNCVIFQPAGESPWWSDLGDEVEVGPARVLVEGHPALRHVDAASIRFVGARQLTPPAGAQVLVADDTGLPLVYKARHEGHTAIVVNLDPLASDFYFSAWFPVLVHSAAAHLAGREEPLAAAYRPGQAVPIPGGREDLVTTVTLPDSGAPADRAADDDPAADVAEVQGEWFTGVDRLGFYRLANSRGAHQFGAGLFSTAESLLNAPDAESHHEPLSRGRSPAHWLTVLAIVVLAGESLLYQRRKVG